MTTGYGMKSSVLWQFQDSFGTSKVDSQFSIPIVSESIEHTIEQLVEQNNYARFDESPYHEGTNAVAGDISMEAHPLQVGFMLRAVSGQCVTTSDTTENVHLFNFATSDFDCFAAVTPATIEINRDVGSAGLYSDMCGNSFSLTIANGQILNVSGNFMGAGFTRLTPSTPVYQEASPFKWDSTSAQYNGNEEINITDLTLDVNNNLESRYTLVACKWPTRIKRTGQRTVELSGTMEFATHSAWLAFDSQSELPFVVNWAGLEAPNALKIDIPKLRFTQFAPTISDNGIVQANFTARGIYSTNSANTMQLTLTNTQEFYVAGDVA